MLMTNEKIIASVDQSDHSEGVTDAAVWAAKQLALPVEFLHVLDRHLERAQSEDHSGAIGVDAQENLLESLSQEDASKSKMAREQGRLFLSRLRTYAATKGLDAMDTRQRHGRLLDTLTELAPEARMVVLGRNGESSAAGSKPADVSSTVSELIKHLPCPVLLTRQTFTPPQQVLLAFDGHSATRHAVRAVAESQLLSGLPIHVLMAGRHNNALQRDQQKQLDWAHEMLAARGFNVTSARVGGDAAVAIAHHVRAHAIDLLAMGVGRHSAIRHLLLGSNTAEILRASQLATLIVR